MNRIFPHRSTRALLATILLGGVCISAPVFAQSAPSIVLQPRLEPLEPSPAVGLKKVTTPATTTGPAAPAADVADKSFRLLGVQVTGAKSIPPAQLSAAWSRQIETSITVRDAYEIGNRVAAAYTAAGYELFSVSVPPQNFADGILRLQIVEGYVDAVQIQGDTEGADLTLLRGYAAHIVEDRPLRRATLERYVLLMNAIPGYTVGSDFQVLPGAAPGVVQLRLGVSRKRLQYGLGIQNQGQNILGQTQVGANVVGNSLLRSGDRTQLAFSTPIDLKRFQFISLSHSTPLGTDGASLTFSAADLLTHPIHQGSSGNAVLASLVASYPIIRSIHESMVATLGLDMLNSNNVLLGQTLSDERTRSVRAGLSYVTDTWLDGVSSASVSLAQGLDVLGARRTNIAYGGPDYTKATVRIGRVQPLPYSFSLAAKAFGQASTGRLPPSEQFAFGGADFGRGLQASSITADRALAVGVELSHPFPAAFNTKWNSGTEYFGYADWGRLLNAKTIYQYKNDQAGTAGVGVRTKILDKLALQLTAADVIERPRTPGANRGWRLVVGMTAEF